MGQRLQQALDIDRLQCLGGRFVHRHFPARLPSGSAFSSTTAGRPDRGQLVPVPLSRLTSLCR